MKREFQVRFCERVGGSHSGYFLLYSTKKVSASPTLNTQARKIGIKTTQNHFFVKHFNLSNKHAT